MIESYNAVSEYMESAIHEARRVRDAGDYAIGAVIVRDREIISRGGNRVKLDINPVRHAEIVAICDAAEKLQSRVLTGCVLYTTHEPCPMCASAAVWARMDGIVSGADMYDMVHYRSVNGNPEWSWRTIYIPASDVLERGEPRLFHVRHFMRDECKALFHS